MQDYPQMHSNGSSNEHKNILKFVFLICGNLWTIFLKFAQIIITNAHKKLNILVFVEICVLDLCVFADKVLFFR